MAGLPALAVLAPAGAEEPADDYQAVVDITFPVSGPVRYADDYHQNRAGGARRHQATDVMAAKLQRAHAAADGRICRITGIEEPMPSWGYQLVICGDDGREYAYVHLNNDSAGSDDGMGGPELAYAPGMAEGVRVQRGQWIGYVGDSGNAEDTAPHLHFQIYDPTLDDPRLTEAPYVQGRINPFPSLEAARARGDVPEADDAGPPTADPPATPEPAQVTVRRLSGVTRIETAVALSSEATSASAVVIAPADTHPEALIAAPLAALLEAPVLLTGAEVLPTSVAEEIERLGATAAVVIGRADQIGSAVLDGLGAAGIEEVERLSAPDPMALSAVVARAVAEGTGGSARILLALGASPEESRAWPDALSASALAAHRREPILLTTGESLPAAVADALDALGPEVIDVVGGEAAIRTSVAEAARTAAGGEATLRRLAGPTRYETSLEVSRTGIAEGLDAPAVWLATGRNFPDALAAGPAAARAGAPLLLLDGEAVGGAPEVEAWIGRQAGRVRIAIMAGGESAISAEVAEEVARRLR